MYYKEELGFVYPEKCDEHMINVKHIHDTNFDENYPYLDKTKFYKFKRILLTIGLYVILFPFLYFKYGLRIYKTGIYKTGTYKRNI